MNAALAEPPPLEYVKFNERHKITDMYIPLVPAERSKRKDVTKGFALGDEPDLAQAYAYISGDIFPHLLFNPEDTQMYEWFTQLWAKSEAGLAERDDFRLKYDGTFFRANRQELVDDTFEVGLRAIPKEPPRVPQLRLPAALKLLLLDTQLVGGGLVLISGAAANGKTTTAVAMLVSRLEIFAGFANCVEDPPEHNLNRRWFGKGRCRQIEAKAPPGGESGSAYAYTLRKMLRAFPVNPAAILMIGEIRDPATAAAAIREAGRGHLVIATIHGETCYDALKVLVDYNADTRAGGLGTDTAITNIAKSLRLCVTQELKLERDKEGWDAGQIDCSIFYNPKAGSDIGKHVRETRLAQVENFSAQQTQKLHTLTTTDIDQIKKELASVKP